MKFNCKIKQYYSWFEEENKVKCKCVSEDKKFKYNIDVLGLIYADSLFVSFNNNRELLARYYKYTTDYIKLLIEKELTKLYHNDIFTEDYYMKVTKGKLTEFNINVEVRE